MLKESVKNLKRIRVAIVNQSENAFQFNQRLMETYSRIAQRGYPSKCDISEFSRFIFTSINGLKSLMQYYPDITVIVIKSNKKEIQSVLNLEDSHFSNEKSNWYFFSDCSDSQQCFADVCMTISKEMRKYIIGFDGWASSGKGTIATMVANHYDGKAIDTGEYYRAVAYELGVKRKNSVDSPNILEKFNEVFKNFKMDDYSEKKVLRLPAVNDSVSLWAELPVIREELFWVFMREIHDCDESVVCVEGRDVTTFLCRTGLSNWFVTCSLEQRAKRRNIDNGLGYDENMKSLANRDEIDANRQIHPCYFDAKLATELDNENTTPSVAFCVVINHSTEKVLNWKRQVYQQDNVLEVEDRFAERSR